MQRADVACIDRHDAYSISFANLFSCFLPFHYSPKIRDSIDNSETLWLLAPHSPHHYYSIKLCVFCVAATILSLFFRSVNKFGALLLLPSCFFFFFFFYILFCFYHIVQAHERTWYGGVQIIRGNYAIEVPQNEHLIYFSSLSFIYPTLNAPAWNMQTLETERRQQQQQQNNKNNINALTHAKCRRTHATDINRTRTHTHTLDARCSKHGTPKRQRHTECHWMHAYEHWTCGARTAIASTTRKPPTPAQTESSFDSYRFHPSCERFSDSVVILYTRRQDIK